MTMSLNEVDAMVRKAARGAGLDWGLAEEAGRAARWLCAQGQDGVGAAAKALAGPKTDRCTVSSGARLADCAADLRNGPARFKDVLTPQLFLPFAALAAKMLQVTIEVDCDGHRAMTDGQSLTLSDDFPDHASTVTVRVIDVPVGIECPMSRAMPDPEDWAQLEALAKLTYAPATDESRLNGAGAGLSDND